MRVLVCGGRDNEDQAGVWRVLDELRPDLELVVAGGARGIDSLAEAWCDANGFPCAVFPAPWHSHLRYVAGPTRNGWMLRFGQPDLVIAFPGGTGTEDMAMQAMAAGVKVRRVP